jgi:hypothetical protein
MQYSKQYYYHPDGDQDRISTIYVRKQILRKQNRYRIEAVTDNYDDANRIFQYAKYCGIKCKSILREFAVGKYWYTIEVCFSMKSSRSFFVDKIFYEITRDNRILNYNEILDHKEFQKKIKDRLSLKTH